MVDLGDGTYKQLRGTHRLGESVFHASYGDRWTAGPMGSAYFACPGSTAQDGTRHYFLSPTPGHRLTR